MESTDDINPYTYLKFEMDWNKNDCARAVNRLQVVVQDKAISRMLMSTVEARRGEGLAVVCFKGY